MPYPTPTPFSSSPLLLVMDGWMDVSVVCLLSWLNVAVGSLKSFVQKRHAVLLLSAPGSTGLAVHLESIRYSRIPKWVKFFFFFLRKHMYISIQPLLSIC